MKKFLAIVMCLAMALSMMTVVSFAADITVGGANTTAAPGAVVEIPVTINTATDIGIAQIDLYAPEGVAFEVVPGSATTTDITIDDNFIGVYNDSGITLSGTILTIKVTAPETAGNYDFTFDKENCMFMDAIAYEDMPADFIDFALTVEAAEVNPEAAIIATPTEAPNGGVVKVLQFANAAEFGIKYTGSNTDWAGQEFPSLATTGTIAAVEVVGLDDSFEAYAR